MEYKELAEKLGLKNILIRHINSDYYKDCITVIINEDLIMNLVGKTFSFIPTTEKGIKEELTQKSAANIINKIREELRKESY